MQSVNKALVAVESPIARDPRVRRQIEWLTEAGYAVDCLALGEAPPEELGTFFPLGPPLESNPIRTLLLHLFTSRRRAFRSLTLSRFPIEVRRRVREGYYELVVLNDRHFTPWVADPADFPPGRGPAHVHLDLHEYFVPTLRPDSLWRVVTRGYYRWARSTFAHPRFTSRSTVNSGIARAYERELGVADIAVVRNSPAYAALAPSPVDPARIRLIHHGAARWDRGLAEMVDAMHLLDERFEMTFMLLGDPTVREELQRRIVPLGDRARIVPPVSTAEIAVAIQPYDLEVMFYPPRTRNLELALPNKLFEAVQARLGLVIGESAMMSDIVHKYGNGTIVNGWTGGDLASELRGLTSERVTELKAASDRAARELNADLERHAFLESALRSAPRGTR